MRINGTLQYEIFSNQEENEYGEIISSTPELSEVVDCFVVTRAENQRARNEDGEYIQTSYTILLELAEDIEVHNVSSVILTREGEDLGKFRVVSASRLHGVGRVQFIV